MEYTHNDDVADLIHAKDREIRDLTDVIKHFEARVAHLSAEIRRLETNAHGL